MQNWKYVEGFHSALQAEFSERRQILNPGVSVEDKKLRSFTGYKNVFNSVKSMLYGEKGSV